MVAPGSPGDTPPAQPNTQDRDPGGHRPPDSSAADAHGDATGRASQPADATPAHGGPGRTRRSAVPLPAIIALVLALVFVAAVLASARIVMDRQIYTPATIGALDAPQATSPECAALPEALPEKAGAFKRVGVREPIPPGTQGYRNASGTELSVRCGVYLPEQYTEASQHVPGQLRQLGDVRWFEVADATPGSTLRTWYSVSSSPVVAVTSEAPPEDVRAALDALSGAVASHTDSTKAPKPGPYPLSEQPLASGGGASSTDAVCAAFSKALPATISGFTRTEVPGAPSRSTTYLPEEKNAGLEPIVVRCGVAMPGDYQPGGTLNQVNGVQWFSDPKLARGSTRGTWYSVGHQEVVALSSPAAQGSAAIGAVSEAISESMSARGR